MSVRIILLSMFICLSTDVLAVDTVTEVNSTEVQRSEKPALSTKMQALLDAIS